MNLALLPKANVNTIDDLPDLVKRELSIRVVSHIDEAIEIVFNSFLEKQDYPQFKVNDPTLFMKEKVEVHSRDTIITHGGWSAIKRVIRHKCSKKMFQIFTISTSTNYFTIWRN